MLGIDDALAEGLKLANKFIPDGAEKARFEAEYKLALLAADSANDSAQLEVNKAEASNEHIFISGWRPFIGWVCGIALTYHFIMQPLVVFIYASFGHDIKLPQFDMSTLNTILMGMLGMGGLRTLEKIKQ